MTHQQILEKAIQKAESNGYNNRMGRLAVTKDGNLCVFVDGQEGLYAYGVDCSLNQVIFSHDFAKAFWGENVSSGVLVISPGLGDRVPFWKYHLQAMVVASDPIKYLGEHLDV